MQRLVMECPTRAFLWFFIIFIASVRNQNNKKADERTLTRPSAMYLKSGLGGGGLNGLI